MEIMYTAEHGISTHTLTWSVTFSTFSVNAVKNFNSHAHVERDTKKNYFKTGTKDFNSHAHVERDYVWHKYHC